MKCQFLLNDKYCRIKGWRISGDRLLMCLKGGDRCPYKIRYLANEGYRAGPEIMWAIER